jgi:hypothetical protein
LRGGKSDNNDRNSICSGNDKNGFAIRKHVILGGRFKTHFCELRLRRIDGQLSDNTTLLYTLGSVLSKSLTRYLGIEEAEISFGLKRYDKFSTVFIYDNVRGGAGYALQFPLYAEVLFRTAKEKLMSCNCEKACTKCLIDRNTQWQIGKLDRHIAIEWLDEALSLVASPELQAEFPGVEPLVCTMQNELAKLAYTSQISKLWVYADSNVANWEKDDIKLFDSLKDKVTLNILLENRQDVWSIDERIRVIHLQNNFHLYQHSPAKSGMLQTICVIERPDGQCIEYLAAKPNLTLGATWGNPETEYVYRRISQPIN